MTVATATRHADLSDMVEMLREQHARKIDVVAPASSIKAEEGLIRVKGVEPMLTDDGVTNVDGL